MESFTLTNRVLEFNGVTIRKAMMENGDYVDLKAFAAAKDAPVRQYLRELPNDVPVPLEGRLRLSAKGFREFVLPDLKVAQETAELAPVPEYF